MGPLSRSRRSRRRRARQWQPACWAVPAARCGRKTRAGSGRQQTCRATTSSGVKHYRRRPAAMNGRPAGWNSGTADRTGNEQMLRAAGAGRLAAGSSYGLRAAGWVHGTKDRSVRSSPRLCSCVPAATSTTSSGCPESRWPMPANANGATPVGVADDRACLVMLRVRN